MPTKKPRAKKAESDAPALKCDHCGKEFVRERSFIEHMCRNKRRFLDRDVPHVKAGLKVFQHFYKTNYSRRREAPDYEYFMKTPYYDQFVRFGKYLREIDAIQPMAFVDYLIDKRIKIDAWTVQTHYAAYLREMTKTETAERAAERNVLLMQQWSIDTGEHWTDFFRKVTPQRATLWIMSGRISPWVLFATDGGEELFSRLSDEQLGMIKNNIDPQFWSRKLERHPEDVKFIRALFKEAGI